MDMGDENPNGLDLLSRERGKRHSPEGDKHREATT